MTTNNFKLCVKCQRSFEELNKYNLCSYCSEEVIEYFNENILHDEKCWNRYSVSLETLDSEVSFEDLEDTIICDEAEYWDCQTEDFCGYDKDDVIAHIIVIITK